MGRASTSLGKLKVGGSNPSVSAPDGVCINGYAFPSVATYRLALEQTTLACAR